MTIQLITDTGTTEIDKQIVIKTSGWVKYRKNGEIHHLPPHRIKSIHERDPDTKPNRDRPDSNIVYESPHGGI